MLQTWLVHNLVGTAVSPKDGEEREGDLGAKNSQSVRPVSTLAHGANSRISHRTGSGQKAQTHSSKRRQHHDEERLGLPSDEENEPYRGNREIDRTLHGARPYGIIERGS